MAMALFQAALRVDRTPGPIAFAATALLLGLLARGTPGAPRRWPAYESGGKGFDDDQAVKPGGCLTGVDG